MLLSSARQNCNSLEEILPHCGGKNFSAYYPHLPINYEIFHSYQWKQRIPSPVRALVDVHSNPVSGFFLGLGWLLMCWSALSCRLTGWPLQISRASSLYSLLSSTELCEHKLLGLPKLPASSFPWERLLCSMWIPPPWLQCVLVMSQHNCRLTSFVLHLSG